MHVFLISFHIYTYDYIFIYLLMIFFHCKNDIKLWKNTKPNQWQWISVAMVLYIDVNLTAKSIEDRYWIHFVTSAPRIKQGK